MKIIVAEHDPLSREQICNALFILGHEVQAFPDSREALEAHRASPANVIISDWVMPEMDGIQLCQAVRQAACEGAGAYPYFILITALNSDHAECDRAAQMGVDDFLVKPLGVGSIWRRLHVAQRVLKDAAELRRLREAAETRG